MRAAARSPRPRSAPPADLAGDAPFAPVAEAFRGEPGVTPARMFGSPVLKAHGKVFAMLVKGRLVVKLPEARVASLLSSGAALAFDPGHGRPMRGWASVAASRRRAWIPLARESRSFVTKDGR